MSTSCLRIQSDSPETAIIARAAEILRSGGLVAFPTETVYGLGANALDPVAVDRIFQAKGRPPTNPVIVHVTDSAAAQALVAEWPSAASTLAKRFWPGPLTLVLRKRPSVPDIVTAGGPTVAVRVPAQPVALALIRVAGVPVAAPSANRSMHLSPTTAEHVLTSLGDAVDLVLDGGPTSGGLESTVLDLTTTPPRLLRPGLVTIGQIREMIGDVAGGPNAIDVNQPVRSPGMMSRHYAPQTPLECTADSGRARVEELSCAGQRVGWLSFGPADGDMAATVRVVAMPTEAKEYAARLYAELHALDASAVDRIVVALPPETDEWQAVRDRLQRMTTA